MRNPKALLITLGCTLFCSGTSAQLVSVGVKGGLALNDAMPGDESKRYTVGPSVEFRLPYRFAAEIDALYMRTGRSYAFTYAGPDGTTISTSGRQRGNQWDFPVLGKYYFRSEHEKLRPFAGTGYSFRSTWTHDDVRTSVLSPTPIAQQNYSGSYSSHQPLQIGATFAAGLRVHAGRISVLPEFRYTRWGNTNGNARKNEGRFLLGISF